MPTPRINATHAITIRASAAEVWPWLVQIGQGRGGFYSYEWIENMMGLDIRNANRIIPEFQHLQVGDAIPFTPDGFSVPVAIIEPEHALVLHGDTRTGNVPNALAPLGGYVNVTWGFYLCERADGATRMVERWRVDWSPQNMLFYRLLMEPGAFVMEQRMLRGIKERAEAAVGSANR